MQEMFQTSGEFGWICLDFLPAGEGDAFLREGNSFHGEEQTPNASLELASLPDSENRACPERSRMGF